MAKKKKPSGGTKAPRGPESAPPVVKPSANVNPNAVVNPGPIIDPNPVNVRPPPFPVIININPFIQSLSPPGAVVGGSDFTLTVLGSNFGKNSTVTWNK